MFEGEMEEHVKKHDRKKKELWKCQIDGCDKKCPAKHTHNSHEQTHHAKDWVCEAKDKDGKTCG